MKKKPKKRRNKRQRMYDRLNAALRQFRLWRARKTGKHTNAEWLVMADAIPYCVMCLRSDVKLTRDHIVPICAGGSDRISNIQPLCRSCNCEKSWDPDDLRPHPLPAAWVNVENLDAVTTIQLPDLISCMAYPNLI